MSLSKDSPHLKSVLDRILDAKELDILDRAFRLSMQYSGWNEIDFERAPGVSYNPRPARIPLIIINDFKNEEIELLLSSIISSVWQESLNLPDFSWLPLGVNKLIRLSHRTPEKLMKGLTSDPLCQKAALIALAIRLDRARHIHQATADNKESLWLRFYEETLPFITLSEIISKPAHTLFVAWQQRFERKLSRIP